MAWPSKDPQEYQYAPPAARSVEAGSRVRAGIIGGVGTLAAISLADAVGLGLVSALYLTILGAQLIHQRRRTGDWGILSAAADWVRPTAR